MTSGWITVTVPGTCGELIQGWWAEWNQPVLISCPIARYSRLQLRLCPSKSDQIFIHSVGNYQKLYQAIQLVLDICGYPTCGVEVRVDTELRIGRGMASSTADLIGVMVGISTALQHPLTSSQLAYLACQIEPSDSTMFAPLTMLAYRDEGQFQPMGLPPTLPILLLDFGDTIDTLHYNAQLDITTLHQLADSTTEAVRLLQIGLTNNDATTIGAAATLSAQSYQAINEDTRLPHLEQWADDTKASGIVRAHSGSLFGLLYEDETTLQEATSYLSDHFMGELTPTSLIPGGYTINYDR